jgi:hypothetical protein
VPAPYQQGDLAVFLEDVPEGIKVSRAEVRSVTEEGPDTWRVTTDRGEYTVDAEGRGGSLWPSDEELEAQFAGRDEFTLEPDTSTEIDEAGEVDVPRSVGLGFDVSVDDLGDQSPLDLRSTPTPIDPPADERDRDRDIGGPQTGGFDR